MNLQTVPQTSGNNWSPSYSYQRAYRPEHRQPSAPHVIAQGVTFFEALEKEMAEYRASQEAIMKELNTRFGMASDPTVTAFLAGHRSLPHLLTEAFEELKKAFAAEIVVNLDVSTDEDGYQTLYAITLWKDDINKAEAAFNSFVENWWIPRMNTSNSDVAFVYQLI